MKQLPLLLAAILIGWAIAPAQAAPVPVACPSVNATTLQCFTGNFTAPADEQDIFLVKPDSAHDIDSRSGRVTDRIALKPIL